MKTEPAVTLTSFLAVVVALMGLLTEFGVNITEGQQTAVVTLVSAIGAVVVGFLIRARVTPVAKPDENIVVDSVPRRAYPEDLERIARGEELSNEVKTGVISNRVTNESL